MKMFWFVVLLIGSRVFPQQVYQNAEYNARYQSPPGWSHASPETTSASTIRIRPTRTGLSYSICEIGFDKFFTRAEAGYYGRAFAFVTVDGFIATTKKLSGNSSVSIVYLQDTTIADVVYSTAVVEGPSTVLVHYAASNRFWAQYYTYITSIADEDVNGDIYRQVWESMGFVSTSGPVAKSNSIVSRDKKPVYPRWTDILGRDGTKKDIHSTRNYYLSR